jgi:hypothetical protein
MDENGYNVHWEVMRELNKELILSIEEKGNGEFNK